MNKIELQYIGTGGFSSLPIYKDQHGNYWGDVNWEEKGNPDFHSFKSFMDDYDDWEYNLAKRKRITDVYPDVEIEIVSDFERNPNIRFNYQMLGRLKSDCDTHLNRINNITPYAYMLSKEQQIEIIEEMKQIYNSFADNEKPVWLTWEQILEYEKEMIK